MKFPSLLLALSLAAATAFADDPAVIELRRPADAEKIFGRRDRTYFPGHDSSLGKLVYSLGLPVTVPFPSSHGSQVFVLPGTPAAMETLQAALEAQGWRLNPELPPGYEDCEGLFYVREHADDITVVQRDDRIFLFPFLERPRDALEALDALPSLPSTLPVDGAWACLFPRREYTPHSFDLGDLPTLGDIAVGVDLDGNTVVLRAILSPPPDSPFADWLGTIPQVSFLSRCVEVPGTIALFALAPLPPFPDGLFSGEFADKLARHPDVALGISLVPPAQPGAHSPALVGFAEVPDSVATLRAIDARFGPLGTNHVVNGIAVFSPEGTVQPRHAGLLEHLFCSNSGRCPDFAAIPGGLFAFRGATRAAVDEAIARGQNADSFMLGDLSVRGVFPSFGDAFPDCPVLPGAILHVDLRALAAAYPSEADFFLHHLPDGDTPLSLDACLYVAPGPALVLHLRLPHAVVPSL